jgi:hypothetical protein
MAPTDDGRNGPGRITLWVVVPVTVQEAAERLAKIYEEEGLEEVLAAFVVLMAEAETRPDSWRVHLVNAWLTSHPWPRSGGTR